MYTPAITGHVDAARLLLDKGADVNRATKDGQTPLYIACDYRHVDAARLLLDQGADINGRTSTARRHFDAVRLLLDNGPATCGDDSISHIDGFCWLMVLMWIRSDEGRRGRRRRGDRKRRRAVDQARGRVNVDAARLLLERGAVFEQDSSARATACGRGKVSRPWDYYPGKISRDCGEGKYDIAYDDGEEERAFEARLIRRLPRSPLDIAQENGHAAVVALLEEHPKGNLGSRVGDGVGKEVALGFRRPAHHTH